METQVGMSVDVLNMLLALPGAYSDDAPLYEIFTHPTQNLLKITPTRSMQLRATLSGSCNVPKSPDHAIHIRDCSHNMSAGRGGGVEKAKR